MTDVFMTVEGRSRDVTEAIDESDASLGAKSSVSILPGYERAFVDFPFTDPGASLHNHELRVQVDNPAVAVAPDIENGRSLKTVVEIADRLAEHADAVVVVPKTVHPSAVPDRFRVGVPLAEYGSGAPWSMVAYQGCGPVHLLGGGPARQLQAGQYLTVASLDTATLGKRCRFGYWDGKARDAPADWDFKRRLRESLNNYVAAWTTDRYD